MQYVCLKCGRFVQGNEPERLRNTCSECHQEEQMDIPEDGDDT